MIAIFILFILCYGKRSDVLMCHNGRVLGEEAEKKPELSINNKL